MKILLLGKNGQVGWELQRALSVVGNVTALDRQTLNGLSGDLTDLTALAHTINTLKPNVVVNAAAYTAVDNAEKEQQQAHLINSLAPKAIAEQCKKINALFVHYSTDYVFNGEGNTAKLETDIPNPLNVYGQSKLLGEQHIINSECNYLIFRTSWVYAARGNNFAKTMLKLAKIKPSLSIVSDQVGAPTNAELIADATAHAISQTINNTQNAGLYHLTASGETSWYNYANHVFKEATALGEKLCLKQTKQVSTANYKTPATRPLNSRLSTTKFERVFNLQLPHWAFGVNRMLSEVINKV